MEDSKVLEEYKLFTAMKKAMHDLDKHPQDDEYLSLYESAYIAFHDYQKAHESVLPKCCHKPWQNSYLGSRLSMVYVNCDGNTAVARFVSYRFVNVAAGFKGSAPAGW